MQPEKKNLYRLPWSMNDNAIGWLEVTDICNIHCQGCYRLILGEGHKPLEQLKEEVTFLKKWRNCDGISLAGGEPILHPDIVELITFITSLGMKSMILSNGYALTEDLLWKLKKAGLTGVSFHIDSTQIRPEFKKRELTSELEVNELRLKLGRRMRKVGLYAHFGITVTKDNFKEIPDFLKWSIDNMHLINGITLIIFRGLPITDGIEYYSKGEKVVIEKESLGYTITEEEMKQEGIMAQDVYAMIKEHYPDYEAATYLGGTVNHDTYKWLIGNLIVNTKGKTFGAYGARTVEWLQSMYHLFKGKYFVYAKKRIGKKIFFMSLLDKAVRRAFFKFLGYALVKPWRFFYPVNAFGIGIVQAPDMLPDGRVEMCDDCPDMCVYEGKLVNSCRLDEHRKFGELLTAKIDEDKGKEMTKKREVHFTLHDN
jgi:MoaA/NifB/PqqE/SkfB family radical SAM enzyme